MAPVITRFASIVALGSMVSAFAAGCEGAEDAPSTSEEAELQAAPSGNPTRYPIVLAHGFNASPDNKWGFYKVKSALEADGHEVLEARVSPYNTPEVRAKQLAEQIDAFLASTGATKVNVVAHSMGGLDTRVLVSPNGLGYGDRVASVTTISTPHRGSAIADVGMKFIPGGKAGDAIDALASVWGRRFTEDDLANDADLKGTMIALSEKHSPEFNAKYTDAPGVYYQSWAGVSAKAGIGDNEDDDVCEKKLPGGNADLMDGSLRAGAILVGHGFGFQKRFEPNDGMTTVKSAKWGTFRGCLRADHLDEVGQPGHDAPNARTKFDHLVFYRTLAFDLSAREL